MPTPILLPLLLKSTWYVWVLLFLAVVLKARQNQRDAALRKSWRIHERVEAHLRAEAVRQASLWRREG